MKKIILLFLTIILAACSAPNEFEKNRQTWEDTKITHYRYALNLGCFCAFRSQMPITIEVQDGKIISMTSADGTRIAADDPNNEIFSRYANIERVFTTLDETLNGEADQVTVKYDSTYGFPTEIYIDYIEAAMDDELSVSVTNFEVIE